MSGTGQLIHDSLAAWNDGGLRALSDGWWHDDIVLHDMPELPDPMTTRGRAASERRMEELVAAVGHWRFLVREVEEHGEYGVVEVGLVGAGAQSGAGYAGSIHQLVRWRDGRLAEVWSFGTRDQALAELERVSGAR